VVVGVTNEDEDKVLAHVEKVGMEFPVAIVAPDEEYAVEGFPTAFLIDAGGRIVWSGHPALFEREVGDRLEALLAATD
jgi:hypothetical protein